MTLPYLPGWGDTMARYLPQIGHNVQEMFLPQMSRQRELLAQITKDPESLNQYIEMERTNPGSTEPLFGKKMQQSLSQIDFTAPYKVQKAAREATAGIAQEQLKKMKEQNEKDAENKRIMNEYAQKDPIGYTKLIQRGAQRSETGTDIDAVTQAEYNLHKMADEEKANTTANEFMKKYPTMDAAIAALDTAKPDEIGAILSAPSAQAIRIKWQEKLAADRDKAMADRQAAQIAAAADRENARLQQREREAQARIDAANAKLAASFSGQVSSQLRQWNSFVLKNKNPSEEQAQSTVAMLNDLLEKEAQITGSLKRAVFVKKGSFWETHFGGTKNKTNTIQIVDDQGNVQGGLEDQPPRVPIAFGSGAKPAQVGNENINQIVNPKEFKPSKNFAIAEEIIKNDPSQLATLDSKVAAGIITQADADELRRKYGKK